MTTTTAPDLIDAPLAGLLEAVQAAPYDGRADLPELAGGLGYALDELFPLAEVLQLLRLAVLEGGDLRLLPAGRAYVEAGVDVRKQLFARQLLNFVPLVAHIRRVLDDRQGHTAPARRFRDELEDFMDEADAARTLGSAIQWGRYGELFAYDQAADMFSLENPG